MGWRDGSGHTNVHSTVSLDHGTYCSIVSTVVFLLEVKTSYVLIALSVTWMLVKAKVVVEIQNASCEIHF